jgi:radical SAM superfamily enzyme YgiQ (UPF0313 family)
MQYVGDIIRPPSEAHSIILQVTVGCSHNACTFCGAYRDKRYYIKDENSILQDLEFAAKYCRRQKTVFLADGDALAIPQPQLLLLLSLIRDRLPHVRRISLYANSRDILQRSADDLADLKKIGVGRIYMGLESGHDQVLKKICKGAGPEEMVRAGRLVHAAGIFLSVTVLLGIAGPELSQDHALATAEVLNRMKPSQVAVLTLMILENTPLGRQYRAGTFQLPEQGALLLELRTLLMNLDLEKTLFHANHASNYVPLAGKLPWDKENLVDQVDRAISGETSLKPEHLRGL